MVNHNTLLPTIPAAAHSISEATINADNNGSLGTMVDTINHELKDSPVTVIANDLTPPKNMYDEAFDQAVEIIQAVETLAGDIRPGDVSAGQIVTIKEMFAESDLKLNVQAATREQIYAMIGLGRFRNEFAKKATRK